MNINDYARPLNRSKTKRTSLNSRYSVENRRSSRNHFLSRNSITSVLKKYGLARLMLFFSALLLLITLSCLIIKSYRTPTIEAFTNETISLPEVSFDVDIPSLPEEQEAKDDEERSQTIKTQPGDTLAKVFNRLGLSQSTLQTILHNNPYAKQLTAIKPNQNIQLVMRHGVLEKLIFSFSTAQFLVIEHQNDKYISMLHNRPITTHPHYITASINGSLYGTARRLNIPYKLVQQMVHIFSRDLDFAKDVKAGDQFSILYQAFYISDHLVNTGNILAVTYTHQNKVYKAVRHTHKNGTEDYYTPEGLSLNKAFSRYPVQFSHISSTFSLSRKHPILHYNRPHKGVDLAAPIGTPIQATADGRVEMIGRYNGFGNMIKISHYQIYTSIYGHLLRFQKGLFKGAHVKRGQIIGYVGQSGLASGPHCHYEFHINKQPTNPTTVALPQAAPISAGERMAFKANAAQMLAQLKLFESGNLAARNMPKNKNTG